MAATLCVTQGSPVILGKGTKVFASGANMSMVCEYNSSSMLTQSDIQKLKFYDKNGDEYDGTRNFMQSHSMISSNKIATTLTKESLGRPDAGTYQCRYDNQEAGKFLVTVAVVKFTTTPDEYNMTAGDKQTNTLKCNYVVEKEDSVTWDKEELMWSREDQPLSARHKANNSVLVIENTEWTDIGPYTCSAKLTWGGVGNPSSETVSTMVPLNGAPKIGKMDTSKNVVQEDDLEIKCDVTGYPYPSVTWKKDGQPLTPNKRITLSSADGKYTNAILNINNLEFEDKGEYTCNATNSVYPGGKTATIVIRVKDKLAALWPFLGIVAEVIVLCVIIFIYEKKRSREMEDEADGGDEVVNSDDHKGKDSLLHPDPRMASTREVYALLAYIFCWPDASVNVDPVQLRFYDGDNKQLSEDRGFRRTVLSSSSSFVNVSLTKDGIQAEDFGTYVCRYDNTNDSSFIVHVGILKVNITDATYNLLMENKEDYTLTCDVIPAVDTETINSEVTLWFKDGVKAENVSPRHIVNGKWSDIGPYTCEYIVLWGSNNSSFQWMVSFNGEARIGSVSVSFNYFQDDDMELSCPVSGYPYPVVTWQRNGVVITPDNRITLSPDASGKYTNAVLNIQSLQFEDKGDYSCTGSSELNTVTSSPIKIRVKDKYAAVWPFIGIVVEVLLLVGIIVVCEKRAKRKKEDTDVVDQPTARKVSCFKLRSKRDMTMEGVVL
uniref:Basigin n=1 Tax=Magallana gigas TaxID=29159 RepID=K1Q7U7_MAGGI